MPKSKSDRLPAFKIQKLDFEFTQAGQKLSNRVETDERYMAIDSLKVLSGLYPVPASIKSFSIDGDAKIFDSGLYLSFFQNLDNSPFPLRYQLAKPESEIEVELLDASNPAAFQPYKVQIALVLTRVFDSEKGETN